MFAILVQQSPGHHTSSAAHATPEDTPANAYAAARPRPLNPVATGAGATVEHRRGTTAHGASQRATWRDLWPDYEAAVRAGTWGDAGRDY